jgi:hypothetical protein
MTRNFSLINRSSFSSGVLKGCARFFVLVSLMTLAACSKDKDFNTDKKTADFTEQNFEAAALAMVQAALLAPAHIPFFSVLSEHEVPEGIDLDDAPNVYQKDCAQGGSATYTFDTVTGNAHPVGNRVTVEYHDCTYDQRPTYVGTAELTYTRFEGLAKDLVANSTETCALAIAQDHADLRAKQGRALETINTYAVSGLELIFAPSGADRMVRVKRIERNLRGEEEEVIEDFRAIGKDEAAIVVLQDSGTLEARKLTTDGDVIYFVADGKEKLQLCQSMYRTLSAKLTDFGIVRDDFSAYMNGTVTLRNLTENFLDYSGYIVDDSDYSIRIEQGGLVDTYGFEDISVINSYSSSHDEFTYKVAGLIDIAGVGKALMSTERVFITRQRDPFFRYGYLGVLGANLDAIRIDVLDDYRIKVEAAPAGSTNELPFSTFSLSIQPSWEDFLARDFEYAEN